MSHFTINDWKHIAREAAMGNGNGDNVWIQILTKHGPWAAGCVVISTMFYTFTLQPMSAEREMFAETLRQSVIENSQSWKSMSESTETLKDTLVALQAVVADVAGDTITQETRLKLESFVEDTLSTHPKQTALLEKIVDILERQNP